MPGQAGDMLVPRYTASIDAAIALAERVLPEGLARLLFVRNSTPTKAGFDWPEKSKILYFEGATPAIALCIAILKAKEASNG
ncbi:hypothetical protein [Phyllobacterium leguminum]|nr:hypothetical protein [Phyllobacterium leguminum]